MYTIPAMYFVSLIPLIITICLACPLAEPSTSVVITPQTVQEISPNSSSCAGASFPLECRTANQAAPFIEKSFATYNITTPQEMAALVSLMAFETADFKYRKNHFPGRPGQGLRNMQMKTYNALYASSIKNASLSSSVSKVTGTNDASSLSDVQADALLDLLASNDEYDFGAAAWFLYTQCSNNIRNGLRMDGSQGWEAYLKNCVGTEVSEERRAYYKRALSALGVSN